MTLAPAQEPPERVERRLRIALLHVDGADDVSGRQRQPGRAVAEAGARIRRPRHRRAAAVPALEVRPKRDAVGIAQQFERDRRFLESELLALIDADRAAQGTDQRRQLGREMRRRMRIPPAADDAFHVVVGDRPARPAGRPAALHLLDGFADVPWRAVVAEQLETVRHVQPPGLGVLGHRRGGIFRGNLAQRDGARIAVQQGAQLADERQVLGLGVVVDVELVGVGIVGAEAAAETQLRGFRRIVAQRGVVVAEIDRVEPQSVDAAIQPEFHVVEHGAAHRGRMEVQVRLRGEEIVQVVLRAPRLPCPSDTAEYRQPVVRRAAIGARVRPYVPIGAWIVAALAALAKPVVLDRRVAQHLVDHHLETQAVRLGEQRVEIRERAEQGIDGAVVGDVVAEVGHRRLEERRDPDRIDAETGDVGEAGVYAPQVAHAVAVRVEEAARVDLVNDGALPPGEITHEAAPPASHTYTSVASSAPRSIAARHSRMHSSIQVCHKDPAQASGAATGLPWAAK